MIERDLREMIADLQLQDAAEHRRRVALAEKHTGMRYEGIDILRLVPR